MSDLQCRKLTFADLKRKPVPGTEPQPAVVALVESPTPADEPSTPNDERTEAQRARKRRQRMKAHPRLGVEEMARLQELLRSQYPAVFKIPPVVPLAYGVHRQIAEEQGLTVAEVQSALAFWINGVRYTTAIARGGARYGLDGKPDGVVTDAEAAEARERLADRKPRHPGGKDEPAQHAAI